MYSLRTLGTHSGWFAVTRGLKYRLILNTYVSTSATPFQPGGNNILHRYPALQFIRRHSPSLLDLFGVSTRDVIINGQICVSRRTLGHGPSVESNGLPGEYEFMAKETDINF